MRCYVSASNRNVFSRFLNVSRDKSVDRMQVVWQRIPHDGTMNGETTVAVTRPCVWNDELAYCYRRRTTQRGLCVCVCVCLAHGWTVQNGWTDGDAVWGLTHASTTSRVLDGVQIPHGKKGQLWTETCAGQGNVSSAGECACPAHSADECIRRSEG